MNEIHLTRKGDLYCDKNLATGPGFVPQKDLVKSMGAAISYEHHMNLFLKLDCCPSTILLMAEILHQLIGSFYHYL